MEEISRCLHDFKYFFHAISVRGPSTEESIGCRESFALLVFAQSVSVILIQSTKSV